MTAPTLTRLEQSFADIAAANRLTTFAVAYTGETCGPKYRFQATGHFDDGARGQIPCATGCGPSTTDAIAAMLRAVAAKRETPAADELYGDEPLIAEAA